MKSTYSLLFVLASCTGKSLAYNPANQPQHSPSQSRCEFGSQLLAGGLTAASFGWGVFGGDSNNAWAFDGSGASASAGYNPLTKSAKMKGYKDRVVADVRDFNTLGKAIEAGETEGKAWVNFFITFQRREPDEFGRAYAALVDLRGLPTKKKYEYEGGDGLLLATLFTKPGKPNDNTPAVKSWNKLFKNFDVIEAAGKKGDAAKAKVEWIKTKDAFEQYLADVELPGDLSDPIYK